MRTTSTGRTFSQPPETKALCVIICHSRKFLFIKPRKTAGSSIELALSPILATGDMGTLIEPEEEKLRKVQDGVRIGQIPYKKGIFSKRLRDHSPLSQAVDCFGRDILAYKIVSMTRNPWDRAVSQFFWSMRRSDIRNADFNEQKAAFNSYTQRWARATWLDRFYGRKRQRAANASGLYALNGERCADMFIRYEYLAQDFAQLVQMLDRPDLTLPTQKLKSGHRTAQHHWTEFYSPETRDLIAEECRQEIALFGYGFSDEKPLYGPEFQRAVPE